MYRVTATSPANGLKPLTQGILDIRVGHQPPSPPTSPTAVSTSYGTATVAWQPPANTGGGTITGYTVTAAPGGSTVLATGTSATMNGLTPGTTYTFTVTATSNGGTSVPSAPSNPVLVSDVNGAWTAAQSPLPSVGYANPTNPEVTFTSVACASTATCVSAGRYFVNPNLVQGFDIYDGLLVTNSSGKLTAADVSTSDAPWYASYTLTSVACPSDTQCIAVGYDSEGTPDQGVVSMGLGSSWQTFETPTPAGALDDPNATLQSISCGSATSCVAVGSYTDTANVTRGYLLTWNGGSWMPAQAAVPANAAANGQVGLSAVNCPSATKCVAVGYYTDSSNHEQGLLLTWSGGSWTAAEVPLPAGADAANGAYLTTVACSATPVCSAFGTFTDSSSNNHLIAVTGFGSSWTPAEVPLPGNASGSVRVVSAACPSASWCVGTGAYNDSSNVSHGLLVTGSGTSWTAGQAPSPGGGSTNVSGVACPTSSDCEAVGTYSSDGLLLRYDGVSWTASQAPLPDSTAFGSVSAVACPAVTACFAAGFYDSSQQDGLLLTGPG